MQTPFKSPSFITTIILSLAVLVTTVSFAHATVHVIQFGGSLGETYSPNALNVLVGDTIQWMGSFSQHPLSSTSVPTGASSFQNTSGSTYSYIVTVAGTYHYQCDFHFSAGMTGSFTATTPTGIIQSQTSIIPAAFKLKQNFPNPFNPTTTISYDLPVTTFVSLKVYDLIGHEVATLIDEPMTAGSHLTTWNATTMQSGVYFYKFNAGSYTETKKLVLLK